MRLVFVLGFLCLITLAFAAKQDQNEEFPEHNLKKYEKASHHHHHHHKKHKTSPVEFEGKKHQKHAQEAKKEKHVPKAAPQEVSPIEAEVQADIGTGHKQLAVEETKRHQEDMHLQDLSYQDTANSHQEEKKRSHQKEKKHHKNGHKKALKEEKAPEPQEEKLFVEPNTKEHAPKPHPVLEDAFETLSDEKVYKESKPSKKHPKKQQKPKKAYEKSKKDKHYNKKSKKENKKDKKSKKAW